MGKGNKGIAKTNKARRREEAEARNAKTPLERTRVYRRGLESGAHSSVG